MRRASALVLALAWAPAAAAAPPTVTAQASPATGAAPLQVTLTVSGDAVSYRWDFGDGGRADGATAQHTYAVGSYTATVTATSESGETTQAQVALTASTLTLAAARRAGYRDHLTFYGRLQPAAPRVRVRVSTDRRLIGSALTAANGSFRLTARISSPGPYVARAWSILSSPVSILVRPQLEASLEGPRTVGSPLTLAVRLRPAGAGELRIRVFRAHRTALEGTYAGRARIALDTKRAGVYRIRITSVAAVGYIEAKRTLSAAVVLPTLALGSRGASVLTLERRLAELHYALQGVDPSYGVDTADAVLAFQKVMGLARTGQVNAALWRALARATIPRARYSGDHIEVDKTRQVLFLVRDGRVALVVHTSTGATGNTPLGTWHVYRKIAGWSWVLWYPSYFLRGFAIHGYPDVPAYPASHGCIRVPMWVAKRLFRQIPYGRAITVYS